MKTLKTIGLIWIAALALAWPMDGWSSEAQSGNGAVAGAETGAGNGAATADATRQIVTGEATPGADKADTPYDKRTLRYYCDRDSNLDLERLADCAENLSTIVDDIAKADQAQDDKGARRLERLIRQLANQAKTAIARSFSAAKESSEFSDIKALADSIADEFEAADETSLATEIRNFANNQRTAAIETRKAELFYAQEKRAADRHIQAAWNEYNQAVASGDRFAQDRALRRLQEIQTAFEGNINQLGQMDPSALIESFSDQNSGFEDSFAEYLNRYDQVRQRMMGDSTQFQNQLTRATQRVQADRREEPRQTLPHPGEAREIRNGNVGPLIYSLPAPGSAADLYGNMSLSNSGDIFGSNSALGGSGRVIRGPF